MAFRVPLLRFLHQVLLSLATTIIAAVVTYLSATDGDASTTAASGAQARRRRIQPNSCEMLQHYRIAQKLAHRRFLLLSHDPICVHIKFFVSHYLPISSSLEQALKMRVAGKQW